MKTKFLILLVLGVVSRMSTALPVESKIAPNDQITSYNFKNDGSGDYTYSYKTADGLYKEETGTLVTINDQKYVVVEGKYALLSADGKISEVSYIADANGYKITKVIPDIKNRAVISIMTRSQEDEQVKKLKAKHLVALLIR